MFSIHQYQRQFNFDSKLNKNQFFPEFFFINEVHQRIILNPQTRPVGTNQTNRIWTLDSLPRRWPQSPSYLDVLRPARSGGGTRRNWSEPIGTGWSSHGAWAAGRSQGWWHQMLVINSYWPIVLLSYCQYIPYFINMKYWSSTIFDISIIVIPSIFHIASPINTSILSYDRILWIFHDDSYDSKYPSITITVAGRVAFFFDVPWLEHRSSVPATSHLSAEGVENGSGGEFPWGLLSKLEIWRFP